MTIIETHHAAEGVAPSAYRAAVVHGFGAPLSMDDVPAPVLAAGQIRVRVAASGLCHTDIHAARGDWPAKPSPPFVPGHEGVGRVAELGPGVTEVAIGDRVAMPWLAYTCGTCDHGVTGWETLCLEQQNMGYSIDGGFGEEVVAFGRHVVTVPDGIDPLDAAPLTCAGVTTYKAVKVAGTRSSDLVAVFGVGGLGHLAIQYAEIAGGRVVAVDVLDEKLELARELGAEFAVNAAEEDPVAAIQRLGGADQAIAPAVSPPAFEQAYGSRCAAAGRSSSRPTCGQRGQAPDLRDRPERHHDRRLDRRYANRPARGLRASRGRSHDRHPRGAPARRGQHRHRRRRGRKGRGADRARALGPRLGHGLAWARAPSGERTDASTAGRGTTMTGQVA
jgi:alcohol dehydrogenase, propanol-preferring